MRIGILAPLWFEIPPKAYGGIEWICYWLVEGLVDAGHEVTLIGAGDDHTRARFVRTYDEPPTPRLGESLPEVVHAAVAARALEGLDLDIVHDHTLAGPLTAAGRACPTVVTAHGPMKGEFRTYFGSLGRNVSLVAISEAQRRHAPDLPWVATVHNAIPVDEYPFVADKEDFVIFLGRMNPEKGVHLAVDAAREAGFPIVLAGKCNEPLEKAYFEEEIRPRLGPGVEWVGQADVPRKKELLSKARCLVFPIQWEEPFGIVMVEAMACGTPVVALDGGSVPEIVIDGVTGYVLDKSSDLPEAIVKSETIDPRACRDRAARDFDVTTMVSGYEAVYETVLGRAAPSPGA